MAGKGDKKHLKQYVLGYDLGEAYAQISFQAMDEDEPRTLSTRAGEEVFDIPLVLARREDVGQWYFGREAVTRSEEEGVCRIDDLLNAAREDLRFTIGRETFGAAELLALFVKRSLTLLTMEFDPADIRAIMFTTGKMDERMVEVLRRVTEMLRMEDAEFFFQSHPESLFSYVLHQPRELSARSVIACVYHYTPLTTYTLEINTRTTPATATISAETYTRMEYNPDGLPAEETLRKKALAMLDEQFLTVAQDMCRGRVVSTVYLVGDGFREPWMKRSLEFLCRTRKVFQGSNLFSKGAAFACRTRLTEDGTQAEILLLDDKKLASNVDVLALARGEEVYHSLLSAGINWFDARGETDLILTGGQELALQITPLAGGIRRTTRIALPIPDDREPRTTRLRLFSEMTSPDTMRIRVTDLGFGDYVSPGAEVTEEVKL